MTAPDPVIKTRKTYLRDLAERTLATYGVAAAAVAVAAGPAGWFSASLRETAGAAGLAAVGSLLKGLAARWVGEKNSASTAAGV